MQTNEIAKKESPIDQTFEKLNVAIGKLDKLVESYIDKTDSVLCPESQIPSNEMDIKQGSFVQEPAMSSMNDRLSSFVRRIEYIVQSLENAYRRNEL